MGLSDCNVWLIEGLARTLRASPHPWPSPGALGLVAGMLLLKVERDKTRRPELHLANVISAIVFIVLLVIVFWVILVSMMPNR